jgi:type I restriction enzyme S subunit
LEQEARTIEEAGLHAFEEALGLAAPPPLPERPLFIARFKSMDRWSHQGILGSTTSMVGVSFPWPMLPLGSVGKVSYGIQKCPANRPGTHARPYLRVANVQRGLLDLREIKTINVPDGDMPKLRLEIGDVLLCEGNSAEFVGRGAIWAGEIEDCVHQNHILRVRLDQARVLPEFVLAVINSTHGQSYFRSKAKRTTNLASINSQEVAGLPIPLPSAPEQRNLLRALNASASVAAAKRTEAATLRQSAWSAFEAVLFGPAT